MKNLPIFTTSHSALSRWQSYIEQHLTDENPDLPISEIRNLPLSQGCWKFVKMRQSGEQVVAPVGSFDNDNVDHQAYANQYFFDVVSAYQRTQNEVQFKSDLEDWPYSTNTTVKWIATTGTQWLTNWHANIYRDYKAEGNNNLNYSVIDWKLPNNAKIAIIGDWGTSNDDAHEFLRELIKDGVDCILHLGDVYYSGTKSEYEKNFIKIIRGLNKTVPVFGIPGNHEYYCQGEGFYHMIDTINADIPHTQQAASYFCLRTADNRYQFVGVDTGINDGNPWTTYHTPPAPDLNSANDYEWAIDKINHFSGKTIMLSHHQLFSHKGGLNSDAFGDSCANPYLYKNFSPFFHNKIAAWYWGHEHSFALYKEGSFGLNQGRLIGSSSYEESTSASDDPYADNYPLVPFSNKNIQLAPNTHYEDDKGAEFYYPHVGAILTLRADDKPLIEYYSYPSWKNGHKPQSPQLIKVVSETISNPTKSPTSLWAGGAPIITDAVPANSVRANHAPAICLVNDWLYMVYANPSDKGHLWWDLTPTFSNGLMVSSTPALLPTNQHTENTTTNQPSADKNPVMVRLSNTLYLVYEDSHSHTLYWCTYDLVAHSWTKRGEIYLELGFSLAVSASPSLVVFGDSLFLFFKTAHSNKIEYALCKEANTSRPKWHNTYNTTISGEAIESYHNICPVAINVTIQGKENLFMVYWPDPNSYTLGLMHMDENKNWNYLGYLNNLSENDGVITSKNVSLSTNGQYLKLLYVVDSNIYSVTMDLGYYDASDNFIYHDFHYHPRTFCSGGIPVLCSSSNELLQTQDFPAQCANSTHTIMLFPSLKDTTIRTAIQDL